MLILYTSDFHFSSNNSDFDIASKRLDGLADAINGQGYIIDIFVFTGDAIDAKSVSLETIKEMYQESQPETYQKLVNFLNNNQNIYAALNSDDIVKYDETIAKKTEVLFKKTEEKLSSFLTNIGVTDFKKRIICCGNHDILRHEKAPEFICNDGKNKEKLDANDYKGSYTHFFQFGKQLLKADLNNEPTIYKVDDYSFLIIDSNITNEYGKACIQCSNIKVKLDELKVESKAKNIAISHKPFFDCCENAIIEYESGEKPVADLIKEKCSFVLFGDKHGQYMGKFLGVEEMLLGSPLISNDIHYCILKTDENDGHLKEYRNVYWNKDSWSFSVFNIEIIIDFCKIYFSTIVRNYIGEISISNIINMDFTIVEALFKNTVRRRWVNDFKDDSMGTLNFSFEAVLNYLNNVYNEKNINIKRQNLFNFRGRPSTGKTFLSSCLFCYLLKEFYLCKTKYVPMYFNLNPILKRCSESYDEYSEKSKQKFDEFMDKCCEVMKIFDIDVLCIIDGLEEKNCYNSSVDEKNIENYVIDSLNNRCQFKYILAFDQTIVPLATENLPQYKLMCDFIYYLRRLDIVNLFKYKDSNVTDLTSIENTLDAYFQICPYIGEQKKKEAESESEKNNNRKGNNEVNGKPSEVVLENLLNLHLTNINFMFLHNNISHLASASHQRHDKDFFNDFIDILENRHAKIYSDCKSLETYGLCPVAYNYYINGLTYNELKEKYPINFQAFRKIKNDEELLQYLTAIYYVNTMQKISSGLSNIDTSIFSCFIPRNISLMIRWYIERNNKIKVIGNFINYLLDKKIKIPYQMKSVLFYLAGFLKRSNLLPLVKNLKIDITLNERLSDEMICFNEYCIVRSEEMAKIICCRDEEKRRKYKKEFVNKLFDCKEFREMNRVFQSVYYGDNTMFGYSEKSFYPTKDIIYKGLDFYNTFLTLIAKYDFSFKKGENFKDYILIDLDMFTLCDIIYNRLQNFKTCNSDLSLYYNPTYRDKSIATLKRTSEALKVVVNSGATQYNYQLNDYFTAMITIFDGAINDIVNNSLNEKRYSKLPYGSPQKLLNDFFDSIDKSFLSENKSSCSIRFKAAYIALFFLPEKQETKRKLGDSYRNYDKNLIVSLLLLDDTIESFDNNIINNILAMGAPCGFGNLTQYFNCLSVGQSDYFNINLIIAKDIYNIVQKIVDDSNDKCMNLSKICEPIYNRLISQNDRPYTSKTELKEMESNFSDDSLASYCSFEI